MRTTFIQTDSRTHRIFHDERYVGCIKFLNAQYGTGSYVVIIGVEHFEVSSISAAQYLTIGYFACNLEQP